MKVKMRVPGNRALADFLPTITTKRQTVSRHPKKTVQKNWRSKEKRIIFAK